MSDLVVNSRLRIKRNIVTHVKRQFPAGTTNFLVQTNQEITPQDILGEVKIAAGFRTIHLAKALNIDPKSALSFLKRPIGQQIYQGELLAEKEKILGLGKDTILSPVDGIIDFYDEARGELRIKLLPKNVKVPSGIFGIVDYIDPAANVLIIKTLATIVYGLVGSGKERQGFIKIIGERDQLVSTKHISENDRGQILVGGSHIFTDALVKAAMCGVTGVVSGGINGKDFKSLVGGDWNIYNRRWSDVGFSVVVTEGFGAAPIGENIYAALVSYNEKFASIDGNKSILILPSYEEDCMMYIRKTWLPLNVFPEREEVIVSTLKINDRIRLINLPFIGTQGKIVAIDESPTKLETGIETILVTVETASKKLKVPYQNIEKI